MPQKPKSIVDRLEESSDMGAVRSLLPGKAAAAYDAMDRYYRKAGLLEGLDDGLTPAQRTAMRPPLAEEYRELLGEVLKIVFNLCDWQRRLPLVNEMLASHGMSVEEDEGLPRLITTTAWERISDKYRPPRPPGEAERRLQETAEQFRRSLNGGATDDFAIRLDDEAASA